MSDSLSRALLFTTLAMVSWVGCAEEPAVEPEPEVESTVADPAVAREAIDAVREREAAALTAGDVDALVSVYTTDCEILPPGESAVTGRDAVRAWAEAMFSQFTVHGEYTDAEIEMARDWAIERYTTVMTLTPKSEGDAIEQQNKGVHVYRRQDDGSWLMAYDVWNEGPAASASE